MFPLAVWAGAAAVAGPVMFLRSFRNWRVRQLIQNTPTARIRSMAMGLVEVEGAAFARSSCISPFSGRACAFWELDIATQGRRGGWTIVHRNQSGHPFYLRDDTGVALVYPQGARVSLSFQTEEECQGLALPDIYASYLLDQHLHAALWRMGRMRFRERVLEDSQRVYVLGTAMPRPQAVAVTAEDEVLAATGTDDRADQLAQSLRAHDREVVAVVRRGEHEPTFILSQQSERALAFQLGLRATAELIGGPALTLLGLGYWLAGFGGWRSHP